MLVDLLKDGLISKTRPTNPERLTRLENLSTGKAYGLESSPDPLPPGAVVDGHLVRLEGSFGYIAGSWEGGRLTRVTSWLWNSISRQDFKSVLETQLRRLLTTGARS
ncbi:hypothetical protein JST97_02860 [bacterium]|nr:hypothetical protein [bacterium]